MDSLELELQGVVSYLSWVLEIEMWVLCQEKYVLLVVEPSFQPTLILFFEKGFQSVVLLAWNSQNYQAYATIPGKFRHFDGVTQNRGGVVLHC